MEYNIMASGDRFQTTLHGHALTSGGAIDNVFVYLQQEGAGGSLQLNTAFIADIVPAIIALSADQYIIDDVESINFDNLSDYNTTVIDEAGTSTGQHLPIFNTWGFEYVRTTRAIQSGRKFIGIIAEPDSENGQPASGVLSRITSMEVALSGEIDDAVTVSSWRPQLWRRPGVYSSGSVSAPGLFYDVDQVRFTKITTCNSRKIGRGA